MQQCLHKHCAFNCTVSHCSNASMQQMQNSIVSLVGQSGSTLSAPIAAGISVLIFITLITAVIIIMLIVLRFVNTEYNNN